MEWFLIPYIKEKGKYRMKHTKKNIEKLARVVVDSWDMDTLICYAIEKLIENYVDKDLFENDIVLMYN